MSIHISQFSMTVWVPAGSGPTPPPPTGPPSVGTFRFDAGLGSSWYLVPQLSDSGDELRAKEVKTMRATGKVTNCSMMGYAYDVQDPIIMADIEDGVRTNTIRITREQPLPDTTYVVQSARKPINIVGVLHTMRIEGDDTGETQRDRIEELVMEVASQGVRR